MTDAIVARNPLGPSTLARDWWLDVKVAGAWTPVGGVTNFANTIDSNMVDDGDFDSAGWGSQAKTSLSWSVTVTVARKVTTGTTPVYDPGQEFLRLAADQFGTAGTAVVRFYKNDDAKIEAYSGLVSVQYAPQGGGKDDLDTVQITLTGQGARTSIAFPTAAVAWAATTAYALNAEVSLSGGAVLRCTTAGTSGSTEPVAPAVGSTVTDGTVTWTRLS